MLHGELGAGFGPGWNSDSGKPVQTVKGWEWKYIWSHTCTTNIDREMLRVTSKSWWRKFQHSPVSVPGGPCACQVPTAPELCPAFPPFSMGSSPGVKKSCSVQRRCFPHTAPHLQCFNFSVFLHWSPSCTNYLAPPSFSFNLSISYLLPWVSKTSVLTFLPCV